MAIKYNFIILFIELASASTLTTDNICVVNINGSNVEKTVGETWSTSDPCTTHHCEIASNGTTIEKTVREYCYLSCNNEYELITKEGQCCGECVQTKCKYDNTIQEVGALWKSEDGCTFYECVGTEFATKISSYKKSCPLISSCPPKNIYVEDCCQICRNQSQSNKELYMDFTYESGKYNDIMNESTYETHPCNRRCVKDTPMTCNYTFVLEWYETLSKACYDCPFNQTDCFRPHCIYADGIRRSILIVNRMMPGPSIYVCLGDTIIVDVKNKLLGESTTIHWHGMQQKNTPYMDGVPQITQCTIPPYTTFQYSFEADHAGTHWWHSHVGLQRSDGAFGALIVRTPLNELPNSKLDQFNLPEHLMFIQDWSHEIGLSVFSAFHHSIGDNKPKNILINGKGKYLEPILKLIESKKMDININKSSSVAPIEMTKQSISNDNDLTNFNNLNEMNFKEFASTETTTLPPLTPVSNEEVDQNTTTEKKNFVNYGKKQKRSSDVPLMTPLEIYDVVSGQKYRFRTINAGFLNCPVEISVDNHNITVIASDGWYFEPVEVSTLVTYAGERFDFILNANQPIGNYWVRVRGLMDCDERFTKAFQVAVLRYAGASIEYPTGEPTYDYVRDGLQMNALNKGTGHVHSISVAELTSIDEDDVRLLQKNTDFKFHVFYDFYDKDNPHFNDPQLYSIHSVTKEDNKFFGPQLNLISMKMPSVPVLIEKDNIDDSKFCNATSLADKKIDCKNEFCECTHVLQVPLNATVELILIDEGYKYDANHPFHLHGHGFRVVGMERINRSGITVEEFQNLDNAGNITRRLHGAPIKDTVTVPDGGYTIIRFVADNPGYWLFHCHIDFHIEVGMALVFKIGDNSQMKSAPTNFPKCSNYMGDHGNQKNIANSVSFLKICFIFVVIILLM